MENHDDEKDVYVQYLIYHHGKAFGWAQKDLTVERHRDLGQILYQQRE